MTAHDLVSLLPIAIIASFVILIMLVIAFVRGHVRTVALTLGGIVCAVFSVFSLSSQPTRLPRVTPLLVMDDYAYFYMSLILCAAFAIVILSYDYLKSRAGRRPEEFYLLMLLATLGSMVLVASNHFASFLLGLETLTIPLYVLIAYPLTRKRHIEGAIKYLILSAVSTSILLFGMAMVYARLGTMDFSALAARWPANPLDPVVLTGTAMIIGGMGFKLAVVPFHMWTPDVYEGAPVPVAAFIATISKGAVFVLLLRYFADVDLSGQGFLFAAMSAIAAASMCAGNLLALFQDNVKRLLGYSSIAHFGYLLVAFLSTGPMRVTAVTFYLVQYFITTIGAFGVVSLMSRHGGGGGAVENYYGLFSRRPWLAIAFTLTLLSLAGIPLTAGFMGKFLIITTGMGATLLFLVTVLIVNSAIGLFYYLRLIGVMFAGEARRETPISLGASPGSCLVIGAFIILLVWWGIFPESLLTVIANMVTGA